MLQQASHVQHSATIQGCLHITFSQEGFQGVILLIALPHILLAGSRKHRILSGAPGAPCLLGS